MIQGMGRWLPPSIVSANLTKLSKVSNKSNHHWWKCNHCPDGSAGSRIEGHDNNHLKHLTDVKKAQMHQHMYVKKLAFSWLGKVSKMPSQIPSPLFCHSLATHLLLVPICQFWMIWLLSMAKGNGQLMVFWIIF